MVRRILFSILILTGFYAGISMVHPVVARAEDPSPDPSDSPTPEPTPAVRGLDFQQDTSAVDGNVMILNDVSYAATDASSITACISFKNVAPVAAKLIRFDFVVGGDYGNPIGDLYFERSGLFSTGIGIMDSSGLMPFNGNKNCFTADSDAAGFSIDQAQTVHVVINRVDYVDGTSWNRGQNT